MGTGLFKPQYLLRPRQILRRLRRSAPGPQVVTLPWGLPIRIEPSEAIGGAIWSLGLYELVVCEVLWRLADPGDTVVDAGANIGQMTGLLALRAGPSGRVLAFEPHPAVYEDLRHNVELLRGTGRTAPVKVFHAALGERSGQAFLDPGDPSGRNRGLAHLVDGPEHGIPVTGTTLDAALGDGTAAVVKMDVEGGEAAVLRGAARTLAEGRVRHVVYETGDRSGEEANRLLAGSGYTIFALGQGRLGPVLAPFGTGTAHPSHEPPSLLATRDPEGAARRLHRRGWRVLSGRGGNG